jgi:hypothetical protein
MSGHGQLRSGSCARNAITPRRPSPSPEKRPYRHVGIKERPDDEKTTFRDLGSLFPPAGIVQLKPTVLITGFPQARQC